MLLGSVALSAAAVRRVSFRLPAAEKEELLDALMPLLPAGVRERDVARRRGRADDGRRRAARARRCSRPRPGARSPAGTRTTCRPTGASAARASAAARSWSAAACSCARPGTRRPRAGVLDLVLERGGGGFGSGSHATTRMCLELLLELAPAGGAADLGCGLGTLAIAAARLGWAPVVGVDRMAGAVEAARANGARNGVAVDWRVGRPRVRAGPARRAAAGQRPAAGPRAGRGRARAAGVAAPRATSSPPASSPRELDAAAARYAAAGWTVAAALEEDGWAAARLERGRCVTTCSTPTGRPRPAPRSASSRARCRRAGCCSRPRGSSSSTCARRSCSRPGCSGSTSRRRRRRSACSRAR